MEIYPNAEKKHPSTKLAHDGALTHQGPHKKHNIIHIII